MKVKELIEILEKQNPELNVVLESSESDIAWGCEDSQLGVFEPIAYGFGDFKVSQDTEIINSICLIRE